MKLSVILGLLVLMFSKPNVEQKNESGSVIGTLCYPGHYIPQMIVYLKNIKTRKVYKTLIPENQKSFKFDNIPEGNYVSYAYTVKKTITDSNGNSSKGSGGYTKMVPCGLSVNCKDHTLIQFKVIATKATRNIEICDWYGATVPNE